MSLIFLRSVNIHNSRPRCIMFCKKFMEKNKDSVYSKNAIQQEVYVNYFNYHQSDGEETGSKL